MNRILIYLTTLCLMEKAASDKHVLYDTKSATSDLDWTLQPAYNGWEELSNLDLDGNTIRSYQVCNSDQPGQDNWARSPYIDARFAKRIYIEIEFSVMKCRDCRETFAMYYYESDSDVASSTFPPWHENPYIKLDTIAASERFESDSIGPDGINKKTLVIGPMERRGFYIAVQDQGACMSLMSLKLYYFHCPEVVRNLAVFPKTVSGGLATSLVPVSGQCIENAVHSHGRVPKYRCNSNGEWKVPTGDCHCLSGYAFSGRNRTHCTACSVGHYKPASGNGPCVECPAHSRALTTASTSCTCEYGYYRAASDPIGRSCTQPPSAPYNVSYTLNGTSVSINWLSPVVTGNRDDLHYSVSCEKCNEHYAKCRSCPNFINYFAAHHSHLTDTSVLISDLELATSYIVKVTSRNGVSSVSPKAAEFQLVRFKTGPAALSISELTVVEKDKDSVTLSWTSSETTVTTVLGYDVMVKVVGLDDGQTPLPVRTIQAPYSNTTINGLTPGHEYLFQVRARGLHGTGHYSDPIVVNIGINDRRNEPVEESNMVLIAGVSAGAVLLILMILAVVLIRRKKVQRKAEEQRIQRKLAEETSSFLTKDGLGSSATGGKARKTYVDYRDPHQGVREVACEVDKSQIKIERVIGQGEFGEVCRGKLADGKRSYPVAVKRLRYGASLIDHTNFLREACTLAQFSHPNIVQFKGVVTKSVPAMILTEFMENGSLDCFLRTKSGDLSILQLLKMLKGIASGMKYLSSINYIHRDLAARNILVGADLQCKVSDFGLSRTLENNPHATYTTQGGKIALRWTAPECIRFRQFTSSSDVWSYGVLMWEVMSYGEKPYWDMSNDDVTQVIEDGYRLPAPVNCPQTLHNLMLKCWIYDEKRRPSFSELLREIEDFLSHPETITAEVAMIDISVPLLNPSSPPGVRAPPSLDEFLDRAKLGHYRRSFHAQGIDSIQSLSNITISDLERLGIVSPEHLDRFQNGLDSLRLQLVNESVASGSEVSTLSSIHSSARDQFDQAKGSACFV